MGYCRRSTDRQEQSIPDQQQSIERFCADRGLRLIRWYIDDAISGTSTAGRHGFQSLLADAQSPGRDFGSIVCYDVKRFGRVDNDEAGYYRHLLRGHGVQVLYASENFSGDGTDDLLRPVKQWQAREESKDLSKVTIRGLVTKSQSGFWMGGAPPFGYDLRYQSQGGRFLLRLRYNADGTKAVLDDRGVFQRTLERGESIAVSRKDRCRLVQGLAVRVRVVQRVFRMYVAEGRGFKAIADALNRERVPPARGPAWASHYSGQWAMTTIRAILVNPAYCGDMVWNRRTDAQFHRIEDGRAVVREGVAGRRLEPNARSDWVVVKDAHPALVSRRVWDEAQRRLAEKVESASQRGINPRTGIAVDGTNHHGALRTGGAIGTAVGKGRNGGGWTGIRARFLLSGLCSCTKCSSRYEGYANRGPARRRDAGRAKRYYYACGAAIRRGPSVCRLGMVRQESLEDAVKTAVVEYYKRFDGKAGPKRLEEVARASLGDKHARVQHERDTLTKRLAKVEVTLRNLLDNITSVNRALVDERVVELSKERDALRARVEEVDRLTLSQGELRQVVAEARRFLSTLVATLESDDLESRQAAIRRCVRRVWIDHEGSTAQIEVLTLPALSWRADGAAVEMVRAALG